jgi:replicative DNA helicase
MHSISKIIALNKDSLSDVKKSLVEIDFKDTNDLLIFQEIMTNLNDIKPIEFFSNDQEFSKKSILGYAEIVKNLISDNQAFSFVLL